MGSGPTYSDSPSDNANSSITSSPTDTPTQRVPSLGSMLCTKPVLSPRKIRLRYNKPLSHAHAYGFAKLRRKCHIVKFIFSQGFSQGANSVYPSSTQGVAKLFPSPSCLHGLGNPLPNSWERWEKGGRNAWLRLTKTMTKTKKGWLDVGLMLA